ncbi:MAG: aspartate aminotransferase family protein [Gammaproteobacteria bacterium]|nr:aspartate aminotransferase family protein [Gammaproteobacteria bacterium]
MYWEALSLDIMNKHIHLALSHNVRYSDDTVMGYPASFLDRMVFPKTEIDQSSSFWKALWENPNHIGCHTFGLSESVFEGTHKIERDLLRICAEEILQAKPQQWDGYVASGGTEANIQALWVLRNYWENIHTDINSGARSKRRHAQELHNEMTIISSEDRHYSIDKAAGIMNIHHELIPVEEATRRMNLEILSNTIDAEINEGVKFFAIVLNMGSTMYGSVDDIDAVVALFETKSVEFMIHVDAAFGGFVYPLVNPDNKLNFQNPNIISFTLDAHKMLQAPYGTGIYVVKKGFIESVLTKGASYVQGQDCTLSGSRSGANAIAVWMILRAYGSKGGVAFCKDVWERTNTLCQGLSDMGVSFFREEYMNIVTIASSCISCSLAEKYHLVPNCHDNPKWWKIVVMDHVDTTVISSFLFDMAHEDKDPGVVYLPNAGEKPLEN